MDESFPAECRLFEIPGGWKDCQLDFAGVQLRLTIPADPADVLDCEVVALQARGAAEGAEPPDPYWATLWSAATPTAEAVLQAHWPPDTSVLELGCGVGLVGLAGSCAVGMSPSPITRRRPSASRSKTPVRTGSPRRNRS